MELFIIKIVSSIVQIILFAFIPFLWWIITARKKQKFFEWIGLKRVDGGKKTAISIIIVSVAYTVLGALLLYIIKDVETATSDFAGLGTIALPAIIVYAVLNTSFPEELLFRGFLLKRLSNKFGFGAANAIQAILFGLMHGVMFISITGVVKAIVIIIFTASIAWCMEFVNEKNANGSILPSWIIHAVSNIFSAVCAAFSVF